MRKFGRTDRARITPNVKREETNQKGWLRSFQQAAQFLSTEPRGECQTYVALAKPPHDNYLKHRRHLLPKKLVKKFAFQYDCDADHSHVARRDIILQNSATASRTLPPFLRGRDSWSLTGPEQRREIDQLFQQALLVFPRLKQLLSAFSAATGIHLHLLSVESEEIDLLHVLRKDAFCAALVNTVPACLRCLTDLRELIGRVTCDGFAHISASICGFAYLAMTLRAHGSIMGILLAGPMFSRTPRPSDWIRASQHLPSAGCGQSVRNAYFEIPVVSPSRLDAVIRLLSIFVEHISESAACSLISPVDAKPSCVTLAKEFIQEKSEEPLTVTNIARHASLHPDHLGKIFRNATGMTLTEYIARVRVENVKERLPERSCRMAEIAFAAGFQSLAQFNRDFKKYAGMSPSRYRALLLAGQLFVLTWFMLLPG